MEVTVTYKQLTAEEEREFNDYIAQKLQAVETLLTKFPDDAKILNVHIEKFEKHDAYKLELRLKLPSKEILAEETSHAITKSVDLAKDRLITQIKRHIDHLQKK